MSAEDDYVDELRDELASMTAVAEKQRLDMERMLDLLERAWIDLTSHAPECVKYTDTDQDCDCGFLEWQKAVQILLNKNAERVK